MKGLIKGVDYFSLADLFRKAAALKKLELLNPNSNSSQKIKEYMLTEDLLKFLAERGFKRHDRPDPIFTLADENFSDQGNYWNFQQLENEVGKFDLKISLSVSFEVDMDWGIILRPQACGAFLSPAYNLPHFHLFKALIESDETSSGVAREMARTNGRIIVPWTELGLDGIRQSTDLFCKFINNNKEVFDLGQRREIFFPSPYSKERGIDGNFFFVKSVQPQIIRAWGRQLKKYRESLIISRRKKKIN
jgi:hypothetical protein